jgi:phosphate transport system substrate-binding protein
MFARRSACNNLELISETSGMMPNFAGIEKFFAYDFQGLRCGRPLLLEAILHAPNPKRKSFPVEAEVHCGRRLQHGPQAVWRNLPEFFDSKKAARALESSRECHTVSLSLPHGQVTNFMDTFDRMFLNMLFGRLLTRFASVAAALALAGSGHASAQLLINGAGATFPYPIYSKWFDQYSKVDPSVRFNYQSIGSGGGQKQILEGTVDFGATDGPMSDRNLAKASGKILHVPTVAGADVVTYNLPGAPRLRLDGPSIAGIFLGRITKWNDPLLVAQNPGVALPGEDILVVHRADGSGTTYIFVDYLSSVSRDWEKQVGRGPAVKWPAGLGAKGNEGVTGQIKQMPGAIGYIELVYAIQNQLAYASIKNAAGNYITPSVASVTAALAAATVPDDFRFSMVNPPGADVYPIAGATWLLVYQQQRDAAKGRKMVEFLKWAMNQGEAMAPRLEYAPLPPALSQRVLAEIGGIKY